MDSRDLRNRAWNRVSQSIWSRRSGTPVIRMLVTRRVRSAGDRVISAGGDQVAVRGVGDRHLQRGGLAPGGQAEAVGAVQDLGALEPVPAPVVGLQAHRVPHVPRADVRRVPLHQAEDAVHHAQPAR